MTRRWLEDLDQENETVDPSTYAVEVVDARSSETSSGGHMVWMDMKILGGPDDGRVVSVSVNLPEDGGKGLHFARQKLRGFNPQIKAAKAFELPTEQQADAIANAITGVRVEADLTRQTGTGPYAGNQQLDATRQIVQVAPPQAQHQVTVETTTTPTVTTNGGTSQTASVPADVDPPF